MKKIFLYALIGMLASPSFAQARKNERKPQFTPAQMAELKVKQLALKLELNKSQQSKLSKLFESEMKSKQEAMKLRQTQKSEAKPADKDAQFKRKVAVLDQKLAFQNELKSILTETQYTSWKRGAARMSGKKMKQGKRGKQNFKGRQGRSNRSKFAGKRGNMKRHINVQEQ